MVLLLQSVLCNSSSADCAFFPHTYPRLWHTIILLYFSLTMVLICTGSLISVQPPPHHSTAAKSPHITKSDDYTEIHSYYPRGGKHEPFQAAAALHSPPPSRIPLLPGLFFPETLTTNDSGATPEHPEWQRAPGTHGRDTSIMQFRWMGWQHCFPESQTAVSSLGSCHTAFGLVAERRLPYTWKGF